VPVAREALAPSDDDVAWARRVLEAAGADAGAVLLDGAMVDRPVVERARRVLDRAAGQTQ
jgi:citrate lyase subunit beta/citryl-CoA lyase